MTRCGFLCIYFAQSLLNFPDLWVNFLKIKFEKLFKYYCPTLLFLSENLFFWESNCLYLKPLVIIPQIINVLFFPSKFLSIPQFGSCLFIYIQVQ